MTLFGRRGPGMAVLWLLAALAAWSGAPRAEDAKARAERFDGMIESMNASSSRRDQVVETIYGELRGPNSREMHELLRESLFRSNSLILIGAVDALAMLGNSGDVANIAALLATSSQMEVKLHAARLLPAFCLASERARFNYIRYASGHERTPNPQVLEPLRLPPLTRRGRLDPALERLQVRVVRILAGQFDPVADALRYLDDILYRDAARRTVSYFVGNALGNDPGRWARIWAAQGREMDVLVPDEIEEIRLAALQSLSDLGAEGLAEIVDAFRILEAAGGEILPQALYETLTVMCRSAFEGYPALAGMRFEANDSAEAENWRLRRYASAVRVAAYTAETASAALERVADAGAFAAAAAAMGAALSYPEAFPDADGALASAREAGSTLLERMAMLPDISVENRASVLAALGEIGTKRAVAAIESIIQSPYCSPERGAAATRLAESAIAALLKPAAGNRAGTGNARAVLLSLLSDERVYPPLRTGTPPVGLSHMTLWRLQRLAKTNSISFEPEIWKVRLGW